MLKEVGASGQISLGKKFAGQLFDMQIATSGAVTLTPMKVVPMATPTAGEEPAVYKMDAVASTAKPVTQADRGLTPERLARRARTAQTATGSPAKKDAARDQWEEENKVALEQMTQRMAKMGSMGLRIHEWRKEKALKDLDPVSPDAGKPA